MQRVPGKERCHHRAAPGRSSHPAQDLKEQQGVRQMEEQIGEVMATRMQAIELAIEHVREPG